MRLIFIAQKRPYRQYDDTAELIDQTWLYFFCKEISKRILESGLKNVILTDIS